MQDEMDYKGVHKKLMQLMSKAATRLKSRFNIPFWFPTLFKKTLIRANYRKSRKCIKTHGKCNVIVEGMISRLLRQDAMVVVDEEWLNEKIKETGKEAGGLKMKAKEERVKCLQEMSVFNRKKTIIQK